MTEQNQRIEREEVENWVLQNVPLISCLLVIVVAVIGIIFLLNFLKGRQELIKERSEEIISQLDQLDPLARIQVAQHVLDEELGKVKDKD